MNKDFDAYLNSLSDEELKEYYEDMVADYEISKSKLMDNE